MSTYKGGTFRKPCFIRMQKVTKFKYQKQRIKIEINKTKVVAGASLSPFLQEKEKVGYIIKI